MPPPLAPAADRRRFARWAVVGGVSATLPPVVALAAVSARPEAGTTLAYAGNDAVNLGREAYNDGLLKFAVIGFVVAVVVLAAYTVTVIYKGLKGVELAQAMVREQTDNHRAQNESWLEQVNALRVQLADERSQHRQEVADNETRHQSQLEAQRVRYNEREDFERKDKDRLIGTIDKLQSALTAATLQALTKEVALPPIKSQTTHTERATDA